MIISIPLICLLVVRKISGNVTVIRAEKGNQDSFSAPGVTGYDCTGLGGYWKSETSCFCNYQLNTFYNDNSNYKCYDYKSSVCTVQVDSDPIANENKDQDFRITNCKSCNYFHSIFLWNLQSPNDKKGTWSAITNEGYVTYQNSQVTLHTSKFNTNNLWSGQLIKIVFNSKKCLLIKIPGKINYPFDTTKLFVQPTTGKVATTLSTISAVTTESKTKTTDSITKTFTQTLYTQSSSNSAIISPVHTATMLSSTENPSMQPHTTKANSNSQPYQGSLDTSESLPLWVVPLMVILLIIIVVLLFAVVCLWRKLSARRHKDNVMYQNSTHIHAVQSSAECGVDNATYNPVDKKVFVNETEYSNDYLYPQTVVDNDDYGYTSAEEISRNPSEVSSHPNRNMEKSISMSVLLNEDELVETEGYAQLQNFDENVYAGMPDSHYISINEQLHTENKKGNLSVKI